MSFTSPKQLNNARRRACEAGWLAYERGGTREVGEYFVIIPSRFSFITDTPIEEPYTSIISAPGKNGTPGFFPQEEGITPDSFPEGKELRKEKGRNCGKPSIPIPNPINTSCTEPPQAASVPTSPAPALPLKKKPESSPEVESVEFPNFPCVPAKVGEGYRIWTLNTDHLAELSALYESVNVEHEARRALRWLKDNRRKLKTPDGMPRFLSNWMKGEQNKGGSRNSSNSSIRPPREITRPVKRHSSLQETSQ